jgi:lipid-binding SYLF domain-containing protein
MLLVSQRALERFQARDKFSLGAEAGVTLLDYSAVRGRADFGQGTDVILWSDAQGVFAGASLAITDIAFDEEANRSYYDEPATPEAILKGEVQNAEAEMLRKKLAG